MDAAPTLAAADDGFAPDDDLAGGLDALVAALAGRRVVALTGAGCSTESGIPDYRGNGRPRGRAPIEHDAFVRRADVRRRYWARATIGWERFSRARPNAAHEALAALERAGRLAGVITQNVDRLHHAAGSRRVVELHGALAEVRCLACDAREARADLQRRLLAANPGWLARAPAQAPDGDAEVADGDAATFAVPACLPCGGTLMPDVVFFGGTVPVARVDAARALLDEAGALLVVGSSLAVLSGFRFVLAAAERGLPIAIVNVGRTRADDLFGNPGRLPEPSGCVRVAAAAGRVLPALAARLGG